MEKVELIGWRDSDGQPDFVIFIDGERRQFDDPRVVVADLDDGRGWTAGAWKQMVEDQAAGLSPAAGEYLRSIGVVMLENSDYITQEDE